jgi:hypothetical protein
LPLSASLRIAVAVNALLTDPMLYTVSAVFRAPVASSAVP